MGSYHFYIFLFLCALAYSNAFFASDVNKYLPKKYGSHVNTKQMRYGGGVKSSGSGGSYGSKQSSKIPNNMDLFGGAASPAYEGGCTQPPAEPPHARLRCSFYSGCSMSCKRGYKLPGDAYATYILCENGKWVSQGTESGEMPSCQPDCSPPCQNQGICIAPDQCNCPDQFSGPQCQFQNKPCMELPPIPTNSRRTCRKEQEYCTVTCLKGHQFPDGSEVATLTCKNGLWVPGRNDWVSIPNCEATCSQPCQNGGICLSLDVCQCPQNFRGPQCQYSVDACSSSKLNFNGGLRCSGDSEKFVCSGLYCAEGMKISHDPAPSYTCKYSEGVFYPTDVPTCTFESPGMTLKLEKSSSFRSMNMLQASSAEYDYDTNDKDAPAVVIENKLPAPGVCYTWGGAHYKTFDGKLYSFDSKCAYTLVEDSADNTFSIIVQNSDSCYTNETQCSRIINMYIQGRDYKLNATDTGIPMLTQGSSVLPIPGQAVGIRTETTARYISVHLDSVGISLKWDTKTLIEVNTKESLWNRTEGLCGNIDGNPDNDIITKSGRRTKNILTAASSWQVDDVGAHCSSSPMEQRECPGSGVKGSLSSKAHEFCTQLLSDNRFLTCSSVLDRSLLIKACSWDYCNCKSEDKSDCACDSMNVYVSECKQKGLTTVTNWRDSNTCPMKCSGGKIYQPCGPAKGQPVCGSSETSVVVDEKTCEEGCFCPEGKVLHNNVCIPVSKCPCRLRKKEFPAGSSVPKDCNTCVCENGHWVCTQISCGARCSAIGDPHYTTFDGKKYDFMGKCSYYLIQGKDFSIETENVACPGAISELMSFAKTSTSEMPSCTKTATIKLNGTITIKLRQNNDVLVNGQEVNKLPFESAGISIRAISSIFLLVELPNGLEIWWDGNSRIYVDMPASFKEQTKGLCGTFNRNQKDDFATPEGDVEQSVISFANKWKSQEACANVPNAIPSHPCDANMHRKANAEKLCGQIKSNLFADCHFYVDPEQYYRDCLYDVCSCQGDLNKCLCTIIASYSHDCASKGIVVDWRGDVKECGIQCPAGQKYQVCGDSCTRSCYDISTRKSCRKQCVEGCNCVDGQALDDNGECIPVGQCRCYSNGLVFNPGYKEIRRISSSPDLCTCANGGWNCKTASLEDIKIYPDAADLKRMCNSSLHLQFTSCEPVELKTCKNMDTYQRSSSAICHPGCECKRGYVFDPISKECIKPSECPCHHGGKSYKENDVVQNDCNTCTCRAGKWSCTDRQCAAECSAWGDSHYKTFDGKHYDYQGQCDYVLAKGSLGDLAAFDISIQNVPCGSLGTSCSKSISIRVGAGKSTETLTLNVGKPLPKSTNFGHLTIREIGLYVIIEAPDLGLTVRWDRGTRVYVRLSPKWKNQVKGLCGNYNDNEMDDFQTPSGGVTEVSPYAFGDSWKLEPYCPEAKDITDTCKEKPERRVWAMRKCGILKSSVFMPCHSEVPIDSFYDKCLFDTCACDQGGDCECLCTALAAYAQECNNRGVPIHWRSQDLCPIQCDEHCSSYKPCMSTCLIETCDNLYTRGKISVTCGEDTCVEGCEVKPCPVGQVYFNSSYDRCIPVNECKPVCMEINGVTYFEGDVIEEDSCHTCYCSRGQKNCKGKPCTQVPISTTTPAARDETVHCVSGWTEWINHNPFTVKGGKTTRPKEVEPLPTALILNNLISGGKCSPDMMTDIRCRTVGDKISAKETGLDAECSLERGLVCKSHRKGSGCPDFEIQVYCQCGTTSAVPSTTTTKRIPESTVTGSITITGKPVCDMLVRKKVHETDCYKYYVCENGPDGADYVEQTCGSTMMFNPKTLSCDLIDTVSFIRPECALPTTTTTTTTSTTETYVTVTIKPQCNSDMPNKVHESDCHKFYACENGPNGPEYVEQICSGSLMYNPNSFSCDRSEVVSSIRPECELTTTTTTTSARTTAEESEITVKPSCNTETPNKPHDSDCHKYYVCDNGPNGPEYLLQTCGSAVMYNPKTLSCDRIETVSIIRPECAVTTTPLETTSTKKPSTTTSYITTTEKPSCTSDMKNHQHASDCHRYYVCENGPNGPEYIEQICNGSMMYNPNTYGCDKSDVVSKIRPECAVTTTTLSTLPFEVTVNDEITGKPSCNSKTPNKPHESNCHEYYVCSNGPNGIEYVLQTCGSTMMYNPKTLSCDRIEIVSSIKPECAISTTTVIPSTSTTAKHTTATSFITITAQPECNSGTPDKPHESDCHKFYMCRNGPNGPEYVEQTCGSSLMYNPKTLSCDRIEIVAAIRPECESTTSEAPSTTTTKKPTTSELHITITAQPQCNSEMTNKPHESDCHKYYVCENRPEGPDYIERTCSGSMMYNPNTFGCDRQDVVFTIRPECVTTTTTTVSTTTTTVTPEKTTATKVFVTTGKPVCNTETPNKPHESDCHEYYVCNDGPNGAEYVLQTCGSTMMYNPKTLSCDRIEIVSKIRPECEITTTVTTQKQTAIVTSSMSITGQPECNSQMLNRPDQENCRTFYTCENGPNGAEYIKQTCEGTMLYNPKTFSCDTVEIVRQIRPECDTRCPRGMKYSDCAIDCRELCLFFDYTVRSNGVCVNEYCEPGCVEESTFELKVNQKCSRTHKWANNNTCVDINDCMCVSYDGKPVKPGGIYKESDCKICQCIENYYVCDESACTLKPRETTSSITYPKTTRAEKQTAKTQGTTEIKTQKTTTHAKTTSATTSRLTQSTTQKQQETTPFVIAVNTETPPLPCLFDFIPLVLTQNLPSTVYTASSSRSNESQPKEAIIDNKVASWSPSSSDDQPYLLIDLQKDEPVYGVELKGSPKKDEYVTSYKLLHSKDGVVFSPALTPDLIAQTLRGPIDHNTLSVQKLEVPVEGRYIKIVPLTWHEGISIRADVLGCGHMSTTASTVAHTYTSTQVPTTSNPPICTDEMGPSSHPVSQSQITVSSSKDVEHDKSAATFLKPSSWQPIINSPTEWIEFNFLEPRNLTGFYTKGGDDGWVEAFNVKVSTDGKQWNPILDKNSRDYIFPANYDRDSKVTNYFPLPVQAQYIRLYPIKWHNTIQMKVEILGCYKPYTTSTVTTAGTTTAGTTKPSTTEAVTSTIELTHAPCNYCPGVPVMELEACVCSENLWWNGTNCVTRPLCPCVVGSLTYPIGKLFNKEDCSECICKIGGIVNCAPKVCDKCENGLKSTITNTCGCICEPCHPDEKLCPTNNVCLKTSLWCDGVIHCPDDELNCVVTGEVTAQPRKLTSSDEIKICPEINCPPGFKKVPVRAKKARYSSSRYSSVKGRRGIKGVKGVKRARRSGTKGGVKGGHYRTVPFKLDNPSSHVQECVQYRCIAPPPPYHNTTEECIVDDCPPGYQKSDEEMVDVGDKQCPMLVCVPLPVPDSVCNITGRTFVTFDGTEYRYDICDHVIARDLKHNDWAVILSKNCTETCSRDLHVYIVGDHFVFYPDLTVEYNGHVYTTDQLRRIGRESNEFAVSKVGNVIAFTSLAHGFWIEWSSDGNVKMGVVHSLTDKVDGLCGYFDNKINNDKRKPNGDLAKTTSEFGDSWSISEKPRDACKINTCPSDIQNKAWQLCNTVRDEYLSPCSSVLDLDASVSRCLDTACECLLTSTKENVTNIGRCKCQLLQSFVVDCLTSEPSVEISGWRGQYDCPSNCPAPLVYKDCFQRECEPSCESLSDPTLCPKVDHACYPGCYCPAEMVKKGDKCIKPSECRDCECKVTGPLDFLTYDETNFTIASNCVYVLTRDMINKDKDNKHNFQVLITNGPCAKGNKTCIKNVDVLYETHTIQILTNSINNTLQVIVDSQQLMPEDFDKLSSWIKIKQNPKNGINILLPADQVEVNIEYPSLGVVVRAPSYKYGGKLEGLCGDCNRNADDDLRLPNGTITEDVEEFSLSWLFDGLPEKQTKEQCKVKPVEKCKQLPDSQNPCIHLLDETVFGACYPIVDYSVYHQWCNKETCLEEGETTDVPMVCTIIESYAKECAKEGICVNWHFDMCPQPQCTDDKVFSACGSSCPASCETINNKESICESEMVEGCFCPEGKVLKGSTCVPERECIDCDAEGHHPGDQWVKDICTNCTCEGRNVLCQKKECPAIGTICEQGYNPQKVISTTEECCDKYTCVPEPTTPVPCSTPQPLVCGEDKQSKLSKKDDGCYQNICECIPKDQCKPVDLSTPVPLEDGYQRIIDESDCCAKVKLVCKPELCSAPPKCQEFYELKSLKDESKCCPVYSCLPPQNKCIFESSFIAAANGGERPRSDDEKQKYLKNPSETWTDGPCRECQCLPTPNGDYQPTCSSKQCQPLNKFADYNDYELAPEWVYNQCCAKSVRTACKVKGKIYKVDDEWIEDENYCKVYKCANNTDGDIIKEVHVTTCDTNCSLGYEYEPAAPGSKKCCGTCQPVACVIDDTIRRQDEEWVSPDYCIHYKCLNVNGTMQVQAKETICSKIPQETLINYVVNSTKVEGQCCEKTDIIACKMYDVVHQIGESWKAEDDVCKELKCSRLDESHLAITEYLTTCNTTCPPGYAYAPAEPLSGRCCGTCQQNACVVDGIVREIGDQWKSDDFCTQFKCISVEGTLQVEKKITSCREIPASILENYVVKSEKVPGRCCNRSEVVACKANGNVYKAGDTWIVGTDYCKQYKCITVEQGMAITSTETKCNKTCPNGYEYVEALPEDATCCGECVQAACIVNGTVKQIGERWVSSDYCHKYLCEKSNDALQIATTKIECKPIPEETLKRFVIKSYHLPGKCCNHSEVVACKGNNRTYDVGDTWIEGDNYCQKFECAKTNGQIGIREYVTQCNATCPQGFEYEPASKEDAKCCGTCQQVQCVIDGRVWEIGQEWQSKDYCSKYKCSNISGVIQVETSKTVCQSPSLDNLQEYLIVKTPIEGQCCPEYKEVACKVGNETYKIGQTWTTDDHCKNITCTKNDLGKIVKKELVETCKEYCDIGYQYVPSTKTCCGSCVEVACVFNGVVKKPGEIWSSPNGCTNYTCEKNGEHMIVSAQTEQCPNVDDCLPDHIYDDGCCKKCNTTSENLLSCAIENLPLDDTVGLIKTENIQHGVCVNKEPITNLTQCIGSCASSTLFDIKMSRHTSLCTCCQALKYAKISVPMVCDDGFIYDKHIEVPSVCSCNGCQGGVPQLARLKSPSKSGRKTGRYNTKSKVSSVDEPEPQ